MNPETITPAPIHFAAIALVAVMTVLALAISLWPRRSDGGSEFPDQKEKSR